MKRVSGSAKDKSSGEKQRWASRRAVGRQVAGMKKHWPRELYRRDARPRRIGNDAHEATGTDVRSGALGANEAIAITPTFAHGWRVFAFAFAHVDAMGAVAAVGTVGVAEAASGS